MTPATGTVAARPPHPSYLALAREFPLRPFRSETEYDAATAILHRLVLRDEKSLDEGERDYLGTLELLIEAFEDQHHKLEIAHDPIKSLRFLMEENGMSATDLGRVLGSKSMASEILGGKKLISRSNAFKLAERFSVEPGLFLQPPRRAKGESGRRFRGRRVALRRANP